MASVPKQHSFIRIFLVSGLITLATLALVFANLGPAALLVTFVLIIIEITFSFDNAIVNARILSGMSRFWQQMFLTIGVLIAVFGMRIIFPIIIVMAGANLDWSSVINLALHDHDAYAKVLLGAHHAIASFGGMFLLMLSLYFLFDASRKVHWLTRFEKTLHRVSSWWLPLVVCLLGLGLVMVLADSKHAVQIGVAGSIGIATYGIIHGFTVLFEKRYEASGTTKVLKTGVAGLIAFLYLQVLDASFSLDGVIGAFAITKDVILIAAGLGVGALWVRSLTVFMVHRNVLDSYRYLEHGAYYTIGVLALMLLTSLFVDIPQAVTGGISITIIIIAVVTSRRADRLSHDPAQIS